MIWLHLNAIGPLHNLFLAGLWWNWRARNIVCVGKDTIHLFQIVAEAKRLASLLLICFPSPINPQITPILVSWHPSRENCFVLNVDGSCLGVSSRAGTCGLIRRGDGSWVIGFSCYLGISNNTYAELMAIYQGLNLALNYGCSYICCYSDSRTAIDLISKPLNRFHFYAPVIANIKELLNLDWEVSLSHTLNEGNACADFLAKFGSSNDIKLKIWSTPPEGMGDLLRSDSERT
jgi:ribonuclease HI